MSDETTETVDEIVDEINETQAEIPEVKGETAQERDDRIEQIAKDMGWRGEEDFSGDPEDFVDAETYIRKGAEIQDTMRKHIKEQNKKMNSMSAVLEELKSHNEAVYKAEVARLEKEVKALKAERRAAIEEGDVDKVESLDEQIDSMTITRPERKPDNGQVEVFNSWLKKNPWYDEDDEMADYADARSSEYKGLSYDRVLAMVAQDVKRVFPEKFPEKRPPAKSPVESPTRTSKTKTYTKADLNAEQREIMSNFVSQGVMTEKQFIEDLVKIGELGG